MVLYRTLTDTSFRIQHLQAYYQTNFRAELTTLYEAATVVNATDANLNQIVFLTDSKSTIQSLISPKTCLEKDTIHLLCNISQNEKIAVQCAGKKGNEEAGKLVQACSKHLQHQHPMPYIKAKTIINHHFRNNSLANTINLQMTNYHSFNDKNKP
jgi:hypothetical protein